MGSMGSGALAFYWDCWNPDATADYDEQAVAAQINASRRYGEAEGERLTELTMLLRRAVETGEPLPQAEDLLRLVTGADDDAADGDGAGE